MKEKEIQRSVAEYLNYSKHVWAHIPNEEKALSAIKDKNEDHYWGSLVELDKQGRKKGIPDVLVFSTPPEYPGHKGLALELKAEGNTPSPDQKEWLEKFNSCGWISAWTQGYEEALEVLKKAGY